MYSTDDFNLHFPFQITYFNQIILSPFLLNADWEVHDTAQKQTFQIMLRIHLAIYKRDREVKLGATKNQRQLAVYKPGAISTRLRCLLFHRDSDTKKISSLSGNSSETGKISRGILLEMAPEDYSNLNLP